MDNSERFDWLNAITRFDRRTARKIARYSMKLFFIGRIFSRVFQISIYKLGDVGISSNLIDSLSLTNGQCPPPGRWIMKQWPA